MLSFAHTISSAIPPQWQVTLLVVAVGLAVVAVIYLTHALWARRFRQPFHEKILRPPGWGCLVRRQKAIIDVFETILLLGVIGVSLLAHFWLVHPSSTILITAISSIASLYLVRRLYLENRRAQCELMGFLGECATAEALNSLPGDQWSVFHDVPMSKGSKQFNIDHVAVGPAGVFAIETKAFSKPRQMAPGGNTMRVEGESATMPDGRRSHPLKQARSQSAHLRDWLRSKGIAIDYVNPVVVFPGWIVSYLKDASQSIRDPRNLAAWLEEMDAVSVPRTSLITAALEKHCRELEFYD